jgi:predicted  nucleic acid-binding Zn-ribbon protein
VTGHTAEALIASRRRDSTRRRQRVLNALDQLSATGEEISVSAVARAARVDRSFLYRHHDLRAQIYARAAGPAPTPASAKASRQSLFADIANLRDQAQRLRRQNASLTARLSELLGQEVFRASGLGHTDGAEALQTRIRKLEQELLDLRQELEERTDELDASRAANRDLMALANRAQGTAPAAQTSS